MALALGLSPARADEPRTASATVKFALASPDKPLLILPVSINKKGPFRFVLDTGASMTVLSRTLATKLAVKAEEKAAGMGAGGKISFSLGSIQSLSIGDATMEGVGVAIGDLTALSKVTGAELDGIIGYNFLKNYTLTVDYKNETVRLSRD
jgi:predicted aspartyl protease